MNERLTVIMNPFELLVYGARLLWWYLELGVHAFLAKWYESQLKYLDKRIAQLERELADDLEQR
jgi:hypothetical protein